MTAQSDSPLQTVLPGSAAPAAHRWRVSTSKEVSYEVRLSPGLLDPDNPALAMAGLPGTTGPGRRLVVVDATVYGLYGTRLREYFEKQDVEYGLCVIDAHESVKSMQTVFEIVSSMDAFGVSRRREPVIAIGGGVLTDLVGLAASLYRRSTPYVRVPTTLICMVDAAIGAKTGVNFHEHKNRLGTYHPSAVTLVDREFLGTLSTRHVCNGLAEILKMAMVKDAELFEHLAAHGPYLVQNGMRAGAGPAGDEVATEVMRLAIHGMLEELEPNLWEHDLRRPVDFGHSFSPAIEMQALPQLLHGEAVCIDMALSSVLAHRRGLLDESQLHRVLDVMAALGLPTWHPVCTSELIARGLGDTVRHRDGQQLLPLPDCIGHVRFVNDVTQDELDAALRVLRGIGTASAASALSAAREV
ncbi:sedoheptulose 7-phosphate cyclase [Streptomyces olivaceus]|nr:sedoheptulose 7-phosphate cyclase [Streptomyces olivaceus]MBZ6292710.1 sedoheptulose 7-phosphate cyclase [Streptomyces olivaceus]MBZ6327947.1 sedoheptulose 7-phosphate cyclase [Streptomyces olivaceus]